MRAERIVEEIESGFARECAEPHNIREDHSAFGRSVETLAKCKPSPRPEKMPAIAVKWLLNHFQSNARNCSCESIVASVRAALLAVTCKLAAGDSYIMVDSLAAANVAASIKTQQTAAEDGHHSSSGSRCASLHTCRRIVRRRVAAYRQQRGFTFAPSQHTLTWQLHLCPFPFAVGSGGPRCAWRAASLCAAQSSILRPSE